MVKLHELPPIARAKAMALSPCPIELRKFLTHAGFACEANASLDDAVNDEVDGPPCSRELCDGQQRFSR